MSEYEYTEEVVEEKPAKKQPKPARGPSEREKELADLLLTPNIRLPVVGILKRWLGEELDRTYHPATLDDINGIIEASEKYSFINVSNMRGWCKIWDAIHDNWEHILELKDNGDTAGLHRFAD